MHHRRRRTTRRDNKRYDSKAFRMAEKEAMGRPPSYPPSDHWGRGPDLPVGDAPSTGKNRSRRHRPKKERCPANGTHEFYKERITRTETLYRWNWRPGDGRPWYLKDFTYDVKTCIHCWKVEEKRADPWPSWKEETRSTRKRSLPKRQVTY